MLLSLLASARVDMTTTLSNLNAQLRFKERTGRREIHAGFRWANPKERERL